MVILRFLGWILLLAAVAAGGHDYISSEETGDFRFSAAGELWFLLSADTLNLAQAVIQRNISAEFWESYVQTVLLWPAVFVLGVPGLTLLLLFRRR